MLLHKSNLSKKNWFYFYILLNILFTQTVLKSSALELNNCIHQFISCIDGAEDYYALLPGNSTLIIYLHSVSGDFNEAFKVNGDEKSLAETLLKEFPGSSFLSANYGRVPSWGNAAARIDLSRLLDSAIKECKIKRIILVGVSMGATTALNYAATAPDYIKNKIVGIIAVSPCANLDDLYKQTAAPEIKLSLENIFGINTDITPIGYEQNSFDTCVAFLPFKIKVAVISATEDKAIPIELQKDVVRDLNNRNIVVKSYEIEGKFDSLPIKSLAEASRFVTQ